MIAFPVLRSLTIERYGLFPPSMETPFDVPFAPGPTAIVGVNGSGKTTLIGIALRCMTGPYNLPAATSESELGLVRPRVVPMPRHERQLLARRVADGAEKACATLTLGLGRKTLEIKRQLSDLALVSFSINGKPVNLQNAPDGDIEDFYQSHVADLFGVASFFDVLLILWFLIFMMEDRRALVWDSTAQRQIFRVLFLSTAQATEYAVAQQEVVSADSAVRNTSSQIFRYEKQKVEAVKRARTIAEAEAERRVLAAEANGLRDKIDASMQLRLEADNERQAARLARLKAAETRESVVRELERYKMDALGRQLGPGQETLRYIVGHLLAEGRCLVCGTDPSPAAPLIAERIKASKCPICGSEHEFDYEGVIPISAADQKRIQRLEQELTLVENQIVEADTRIEEANIRFRAADSEFDILEGQRLALDARIVDVLRRIPPERAAIGTQDSEIDVLQRILAKERARQKEAEARFTKIVAESVTHVQRLQQKIAASFQTYLTVFLRETAELVYQTVRDRLGQGGSLFDFPAFHLSMTSGAVAGPTMRNEPGEVSQSQAEFVDLAFRMALMTVAGNGHAATLVVDAPEASLDFLFAERAGSQLAAFSTALPENRVIVTSYLPSEHLLQKFFAGVRRKAERRRRIVDLIRDAAPNAAIRADRAKYEEFLGLIIQDGAR